MSHGTGGWCWTQPACICAQPGCCCCSQGGCCRSAPPLCLQSHGSVRNAGSPRSLLPSAPTRPAGGTHSCWDSQSDAASHTCQRKSVGRGLPPADWLQGRTVRRGFGLVQGHPGQHKAVCDEGRLWWLWCYLIKKTNKTKLESYSLHKQFMQHRTSVPPELSSCVASMFMLSSSSPPLFCICTSTSAAGDRWKSWKYVSVHSPGVFKV